VPSSTKAELNRVDKSEGATGRHRWHSTPGVQRRGQFDFRHHRRGGRRADRFALGWRARLCPTATLYWLLLAIILVCYVVLTQLVKTWFHRRFGE